MQIIVAVISLKGVIESMQDTVNWSKDGFSGILRGKGIARLNLLAVRRRACTFEEGINMFPSLKMKILPLLALQ